MVNDKEFEGRSRDIWSHGGGKQIRDLLSSALSTLLMMRETNKSAYFSSPWISDFILFENFYREYAALFPELADHTEIYLSEYLIKLAQKLPVRIITTRSETSQAFISNLKRRTNLNKIEYRFADDEYHEKGILAPSFYIEGSMNITYNGVYVRGEKISYHSGQSNYGAKKIASAYLEFDRRWLHLE